MTKLLYPFGGAAVRQPCACCTGAAYERSTEPLERLPILGRRHTHNDERNPTGTALAGDKLGADNRLYAESGRQHAPGWQHRRRVGSGADGGADAVAQSLCWWSSGSCAKRYTISRMAFRKQCRQWRKRWAILSDFSNGIWWQQTHAHRQQVHRLLYVAAHWLMLSKGVAV